MSKIPASLTSMSGHGVKIDKRRVISSVSHKQLIETAPCSQHQNRAAYCPWKIFGNLAWCFVKQATFF